MNNELIKQCFLNLSDMREIADSLLNYRCDVESYDKILRVVFFIFYVLLILTVA